MKANKILGITVEEQTKLDILDKIIKYIKHPVGFFHIVSLNPENLVVAYEDKEFKKVVETAQIKIIDGVGVVLAGRLFNLSLQKLSGVDLMEKLINLAPNMRLRVMLIGGKSKLALKLTDCYSQKYPEAKFIGVEGIKNIKSPKKSEENDIFAIVRRFKPHFVFVAFGSPDQELWIERHKKQFNKLIVMGVGGGFDYLSENVKRAPLLIQKLGFEWLYRLINQPWRWKRQLRLIKFVYLVLLDKLANPSWSASSN